MGCDRHEELYHSVQSDQLGNTVAVNSDGENTRSLVVS